MSDEKDKRIGVPELMMVLITAIIFIIPSFLILTMQDARFNEALEEAKDDIKIMNVSDDFREGWNAALDHLDVLWKSGDNCTYV